MMHLSRLEACGSLRKTRVESTNVHSTPLPSTLH